VLISERTQVFAGLRLLRIITLARNLRRVDFHVLLLADGFFFVRFAPGGLVRTQEAEEEEESKSAYLVGLPGSDRKKKARG